MMFLHRFACTVKQLITRENALFEKKQKQQSETHPQDVMLIHLSVAGASHRRY